MAKQFNNKDEFTAEAPEFSSKADEPEGYVHTPPTIKSGKRKPSILKRSGVLTLTALIVIGGLGGLVYWKVIRVQAAIAAHSFEPPPIEVSAIEVAQNSLPQSLSAIGTLRAMRSVDLAPEATGRVTSINFEAGQRIAKGIQLLQMDDRLEQAQLKSALARAAYARQQLDRSKTLSLSQAEAKQSLDQRQSEFDQAEAAVEQLRTQISQKTVSAPFDGYLGLRDVNLGQFIAAGTKIVSLTALDELYVNFALPQQELSKLAVGGTVAVHSDAFPGESFPARINAIDPAVDVNTRNVTVQATLRNSLEKLRPGIYVNVSVSLPDRDNTILVPATAVQASSSGDTAYVVRDGKAEIVPVKTGERTGDRIVVEAGLSPGDRVITTGQVRVYPGARVAVTAATAATAEK